MARSTPWYSIDDRLFEKLSDTVTPQGLLAVMALPAQRLPRPDQDFVVLLEDIQDPGNLGTLIRSAVACGVDAVVISKGSAEVWAPKVLRAGMGAHFSVTLVEGLDPVEFAQSFGGIAATTLRGTSAWEAPWAEIRGIAIGNEGAGLSSDLIAACAHNLTLPMAAGVESLNAAVAGSVLLFERMRSIRGRSSNPG
jgi:TrmH family RNA methyltransferase